MPDQLGRGAVSPWPPFLGSSTKDAFSALHGFDIQVGNIGIPTGDTICAARELDADFELVVQHHLVLPQTARAVKDTENTLLRLHAACRTTPGLRVKVTVVPPPRYHWTELVVAAVGILRRMLGNGVVFPQDRARAATTRGLGRLYATLT